MCIKDALKFEKENMPDFMWKREKFMLVFIVIVLGGALLTLVVSLSIGFFVTDEGVYPVIPLFVWFGVLVIMTVPLIIINKGVNKKSQVYYTALLNDEYFDTDYLETKERLLDERRITQGGFVLDPNIITEMHIPFEDNSVTFHAVFWGGKIFINFWVEYNSVPLHLGETDNALYNYLKNNRQLINNKKVFELFCGDRACFVKMLLRYANDVNIERKLQK